MMARMDAGLGMKKGNRWRRTISVRWKALENFGVRFRGEFHGAEPGGEKDFIVGTKPVRFAAGFGSDGTGGPDGDDQNVFLPYHRLGGGGVCPPQTSRAGRDQPFVLLRTSAPNTPPPGARR